MAERDLARVADDDVQPEQQDGVDQDRLEQVDVIRIGDDDREQRQGQGRADRSQQGFALLVQTFLIAVLPNRPAGLIASTSSSSTRPGTSL